MFQHLDPLKINRVPIKLGTCIQMSCVLSDEKHLGQMLRRYNLKPATIINVCIQVIILWIISAILVSNYPILLPITGLQATIFYGRSDFELRTVFEHHARSNGSHAAPRRYYWYRKGTRSPRLRSNSIKRIWTMWNYKFVIFEVIIYCSWKYF